MSRGAPAVEASGFESLSGKVDLPFPEYDKPPAEPLQLVRDWLAQARDSGVREPTAMALATADSRGRASNRTIAIIEVTDLGLVFTSHSCSQKGREIAATGWASGLLYWRETGQQIILSGPAVPLSEAESDALWSARAIPLHAMSTVTEQSEPLEDVEALRARARRLELTGAPQPRPEFFVGYRLQPDVVEFWSASSDRLHRRLRYDRAAQEWRTSRLQP
ncbi:phenazine biosynthesis FMN-dependent oxidase PhzG [Streptomyces sp. ASQP_92]|uniref:phenazine biosynthesis FMN-dependent oxidase PhzG n=1 Tax=Streptomyces sp. ASQP_92 TaxID=2979116 RepID=UPI0021C0FD9E|nr:phenazine biosynthesis FMN-dependent oxidase PhzG [Streptomyces sp. ASQP_92]MCT9091780.1 phenazine biosynthesis FMN-dependent oxidase PhzG [Streptomyces sp. ASQP_92]